MLYKVLKELEKKFVAVQPCLLMNIEGTFTFAFIRLICTIFLFYFIFIFKSLEACM